jgi:dolichyl-phosphate beta-glucosyltransferase
MSTLPEAPDLSVVIPAFNEEERLGASLERIISYLEGDRSGGYEILVVDDGSRDATAAVAGEFAGGGVRVLELGRNRGKGAAIRRGVAASRGRRVLLTDADLSAPIEELAKLESELGVAQVVLGSRAVAGSRITRHQPLYRELMGKTFNKLIRLAGVWQIHDTQCGFKLLDGGAARNVFRRMITDGFAFDVELVWLARRLGYRVVEVGVAWEDSPSSRVRVLADPPRMLLDILRFRWHHRSLGRGSSRSE